MKKLSKVLVVVLALVLVVSAFALTACAPKDETKVAYGLVHGKGYVGIATVVRNKDTVKSATLDEACFPGQVTLSETEVADLAEGDYGYVTSHGKDVAVYAKVKVGNIVFTVDSTAKAYKVDGKTLAEYFASADNCKAYAEAVLADNIKVVVGGADKTGVITKDDLLKTKNGYWPAGGSGMGWKANVEATCKYVVENGFALTDADFTQGSDKVWADKNNVSTGATWTDFKDYYNLLKAAYNA